MSTRGFEFGRMDKSEYQVAADKAGDRRGALGLLALLSLAVPALLIRSLFPDLDPLLLAGLGVAVYSAYLGLMGVALLRQAEQKQTRPEAARVTAGEE